MAVEVHVDLYLGRDAAALPSRNLSFKGICIQVEMEFLFLHLSAEAHFRTAVHLFEQHASAFLEMEKQNTLAYGRYHIPSGRIDSRDDDITLKAYSERITAFVYGLAAAKRILHGLEAIDLHFRDRLVGAGIYHISVNRPVQVLRHGDLPFLRMDHSRRQKRRHIYQYSDESSHFSSILCNLAQKYENI